MQGPIAIATGRKANSKRQLINMLLHSAPCCLRSSTDAQSTPLIYRPWSYGILFRPQKPGSGRERPCRGCHADRVPILGQMNSQASTFMTARRLRALVAFVVRYLSSSSSSGITLKTSSPVIKMKLMLCCRSDRDEQESSEESSATR